MRARSINAKRASPSIGLMTAAMLTATLIAFDAAEAQQGTAYIQPRAATVMAAVQPIDPTHIGPDPANGKALGLLEDGTPQSTAGTSQSTGLAVDQPSSSVTVSANSLESEPWDSFRHTVAGAATSSCFGPDALPHEELAVEGLLRLPFLVHAAATSACR